MLIRHVQIVSLIAPRFVEHLLVFLLRIDVGAQVGVQSTLSRLRWRTIRVDEEQSGAIRRGSRRRWWTTTTAATAARAVQQLVPIEADVIVGNAGDERRVAMIAQ